jgi:hypothetical protein
MLRSNQLMDRLIAPKLVVNSVIGKTAPIPRSSPVGSLGGWNYTVAQHAGRQIKKVPAAKRGATGTGKCKPDGSQTGLDQTYFKR